MILASDRIAEFMNRVIPVTESGCWLWTGTTSTKGYGRWKVGSKLIAAHRITYHHFIGPIPSGLTLDHLCRVRCCVNPQHLEPVTVKENVLRGIGHTAINARKSHCPNGHPYDKVKHKVYGDARFCTFCDKNKPERYGPFLCKNGHLIAGGNAHKMGRNDYRCAICDNAGARERYWKNKKAQQALEGK